MTFSMEKLHGVEILLVNLKFVKVREKDYSKRFVKMMDISS